ncbi:MAG: substrate-binding domain-containing protein [Lachnospiraceae bacterium]|nr:substrate-binding domain-containing protein [Lachnospiraceae bacterium]
MIKKTLCLALSSLLVLSMLTACGSETPSNTNNESNTVTPSNTSTDSTAATDSTATTDNTAANETNADSGFDDTRIISLFTREDGSGTRDAFVSITGVGDDMYGDAAVKTETNEIIAGVEGNEFAISYISLGSLNDRIKTVNIDGVTPSAETIKDGSYAIQRPFLVCVNEEKLEDELVKDFIEFMLSAQGQEISGARWIEAVDNASDYAPSGLTGTLKVGGSTSVDPLMQSLRSAYLDLNPGMEIEISGGGSGTGISEAASGVIDIGMSSRGLRDSEKEELTDFVIALDGVAVIVNIANPIENLSMDIVKSIFTGEYVRWNEF